MPSDRSRCGCASVIGSPAPAGCGRRTAAGERVGPGAEGRRPLVDPAGGVGQLGQCPGERARQGSPVIGPLAAEGIGARALPHVRTVVRVEIQQDAFDPSDHAPQRVGVLGQLVGGGTGGWRSGWSSADSRRPVWKSKKHMETGRELKSHGGADGDE